MQHAGRHTNKKIGKKHDTARKANFKDYKDIDHLSYVNPHGTLNENFTCFH